MSPGLDHIRNNTGFFRIMTSIYETNTFVRSPKPRLGYGTA